MPRLLTALTANIFLSFKKVCFPFPEKKEKATSLTAEEKACEAGCESTTHLHTIGVIG